jgi:DNA-binding NtrC family response regulator
MKNKQKILIIEDEEGMAELMGRVIRSGGYDATIASSAERAFSILANETFDLVMTDLVLGGLDGAAVVQKVKEEYPDTEVIVITAHASVDSAIEIMKLGAFDYLRKPILPEEIIHAAKKALEMKELRDEVRALRLEMGASARNKIIGKSSSMLRLFERASRAAKTGANVLIEGESGTGKELIARAIHEQSSRKKGPFIAVNCGAIPPALLESELFGHVKGAFTGAHVDREGYFEAADGGTLLLDEIGEMEVHLQIKLLRVLQEGQITRVGESRPRSLDIRIIAATNKNLAAEIQVGNFRRDLYYRLRVVQLQTPPLRDRREDIPLLAHAFLRRYCSKYGKNFTDIGPKAALILQRHDYPGNVRELENIIESVVVTGRGKTIRPAHLREAMGTSAYENIVPDAGEMNESFTEELDRVVERFERNYLETMLHRHNGRVGEVAKTSNLSRRTVERKMRKYGMERSSYRQ